MCCRWTLSHRASPPVAFSLSLHLAVNSLAWVSLMVSLDLLTSQDVVLVLLWLMSSCLSHAHVWYVESSVLAEL